MSLNKGSPKQAETYPIKICPKSMQETLDKIQNIRIPSNLLDKDHYLCNKLIFDQNKSKIQINKPIEFICDGCRNILIDPVQCETCQLFYCKKCILLAQKQIEKSKDNLFGKCKHQNYNKINKYLESHILFQLQFQHDCQFVCKQQSEDTKSTKNKRMNKTNIKQKQQGNQANKFSYSQMIDHFQKFNCQTASIECPLCRVQSYHPLKKYTWEQIQIHLRDECQWTMVCCSNCNCKPNFRNKFKNHKPRDCLVVLQTKVLDRDAEIKQIKKDIIKRKMTNRILTEYGQGRNSLLGQRSYRVVMQNQERQAGQLTQEYIDQIGRSVRRRAGRQQQTINRPRESIRDQFRQIAQYSEDIVNTLLEGNNNVQAGFEDVAPSFNLGNLRQSQELRNNRVARYLNPDENEADITSSEESSLSDPDDF